MKRYSVRPSLRLSPVGPQLQVCCCEPGGQEISIDRCSSRAAGECGQCHVVSVPSPRLLFDVRNNRRRGRQRRWRASW